MEVEVWKDVVMEHTQHLRGVKEDRDVLIEELEEHLSKFFDYDSIKIDPMFNKITLKWKSGVNPIIRKNIGELGMEFMVKSDYDDRVNKIMVIELYPFGVEEED